MHKKKCIERIRRLRLKTVHFAFRQRGQHFSAAFISSAREPLSNRSARVSRFIITMRRDSAMLEDNPNSNYIAWCAGTGKYKVANSASSSSPIATFQCLPVSFRQRDDAHQCIDDIGALHHMWAHTQTHTYSVHVREHVPVAQTIGGAITVHTTQIPTYTRSAHHGKHTHTCRSYTTAISESASARTASVGAATAQLSLRG